MLNFGAGDLEDMRCDWNLSVKMFTSARARVICALGSVRNLYEVWNGISREVCGCMTWPSCVRQMLWRSDESWSHVGCLSSVSSVDRLSRLIVSTHSTPSLALKRSFTLHSPYCCHVLWVNVRSCSLFQQFTVTSR